MVKWWPRGCKKTESDGWRDEAKLMTRLHLVYSVCVAEMCVCVFFLNSLYTVSFVFALACDFRPFGLLFIYILVLSYIYYVWPKIDFSHWMNSTSYSSQAAAKAVIRRAKAFALWGLSKNDFQVQLSLSPSISLNTVCVIMGPGPLLHVTPHFPVSTPAVPLK